MQFEGALLQVHGVRFAIVIVKPHVLNSRNRENVRGLISKVIPYQHIIFLSKNSQGIPTYHGRLDIARLLSKLDPYKIPFKTIIVN